MGRLVINGDEIYELDEECLKEKKRKEMEAARNGNLGQKSETPRNAAEGVPRRI